MKQLIMKFTWALILIVPILVFNACGEDETPAPRETVIAPSATAADEAQTAFIETENDYTIRFEAGIFEFTNTLSIDGKTDIVIIGAGKDETILDFSGQTSGGEGVLATNCTNIRFENMTIRDSKGDALKARDCDRISFVNVATIWSGEPDTDNGAYGLYPVLCTEVYIDNCYAYGASDAGIYVGQSDQIIVKNCLAEGNVAGIEIENSTNADVFDNEATDNTGGILVFDLPGLTKYGDKSRVFNNLIHENNRINFAAEGNIVASVPIGIGVMVLSTKNVEIFNNTLRNNNFANVMAVNYLILNDAPGDPLYNPFPSGIFIHDNTYTMDGTVNSADQNEFNQNIIALLQVTGFGQPDILLDGVLLGIDPICIQDASASFVNLNATDDTFMSVTDDRSPQDCTKDPLPAIVFDPF